jgi:hypothetical protein
MRQLNQQAEAIQRMLFAYTDMRSRLHRIDRNLERFHSEMGLKAALHQELNRIDRDLERFNRKIMRLSLNVAEPRHSCHSSRCH